MRSRSPAWALALGFALLTGPGLVAASPEPDASASEAERKRAAKAEVVLGSEAFSAGDYATALRHYEAAMAILPAPKLHYNIGVCHQRLSLAAETPEARTLERDLAIESYNAYLEQNPQADDRLEVAETIRELGGTPVTMPDLKSVFDSEAPSAVEPEAGDGEPEVEPTETEPGPEPEREPEPDPELEDRLQTPPPPPPTHGRVGINLLGGYSPNLARAELVDAPGLFAFEFYGGGMLGPRRRFLLSAYTQLYIGATLETGGFGLSGYSLGLLGQHNWVVGKDKLLLGLGGVAALTGQALGARDIVEGAPSCRLESDNVAAQRSGALLAPRFDLGLLMGPNRRGMLGLVVMPSFAVWGNGPAGIECGTGMTPWTALGLRQRWHFQLWAGAGFSFRF